MNEMSTREYWDRRAADMAEDIAAAKAQAATPQGQIDSLRRKRDALYLDKIDSGADTDAEIAEIDTQVANIEREMAQAEAESFEAEWTREVTIERRAAWNAWAIATSPTPVQVAQRERQQGWTTGALRRAITIHTL